MGRGADDPPPPLLLELEDGTIVREDAPDKVWFGRFVKAVINADFNTGPAPFRARGGSVRELTLAELWQGMHHPDATRISPQRLAGEFHGRLARSFVLPLLPLLAIPLGMAAKRGRRAAGPRIAARRAQAGVFSQPNSDTFPFHPDPWAFGRAIPTPRRRAGAAQRRRAPGPRVAIATRH